MMRGSSKAIPNRPNPRDAEAFGQVLRFEPRQPGKPARVAFHGTAGTKRADFAMGARDKGEVGASPAPDVEIEIDVEADAKVPAQ